MKTGKQRKLSLHSLLFLKEGQVTGVEDFPLAECKLLENEMAEIFDISAENIRVDPLYVFIDTDGSNAITFSGELYRPHTPNTHQNYTFTIDFYPTITRLFIDNDEIAIGNPKLNTPLPLPEPEDEENASLFLPLGETFQKGVVEDRAILLFPEFIYENYLSVFMTEFVSIIYSTTYQQNTIIRDIFGQKYLAEKFDIIKTSSRFQITNKHTNTVLYLAMGGGNSGFYLEFIAENKGKNRAVNIRFPSHNFFELQLLAFQAGENEELLEGVADFIYENIKTEIEQKIYPL